MADPMTREKLRDLLSDMECGAGPDGGDILAACDDLIAQERAEVERLRAELDARCDKDGCEQYREWLSGQKAEADKRARQAETERDRARTVAANAEKTLGEQIDRAIAAEAARDRLAEQVQRAQDPDLIRRAIADPGAYVKRKLLGNGEPAETVPAWGARAVIAALGGTEAGR